MIITRKGIKLSETEKQTSSSHGSLEEALDEIARISPSARVFLIGGSEIYKYGLELGLVDRILLTRVVEPDFEECDAYFPDFTKEKDSEGNLIWNLAGHSELSSWADMEVAEGEIEEKNVKYRFEMWVRK